MKAEKKKLQTFGELIAAVYATCGEHMAPGIVRLAVNARWIEFRGRHRFVFY
jgi:hypothetical protein